MVGTSFTDGSTLTCSVNDSTCSNNSRPSNSQRTVVTNKKKHRFAYKEQTQEMNGDIKGDEDSGEEERMVDIIFSK